MKVHLTLIAVALISCVAQAQLKIMATLLNRKGRHFLQQKVTNVFKKGQSLTKGYEDVRKQCDPVTEGQLVTYAFGMNSI